MELVETNQARRLEPPTGLDDLVERARNRATLYEDHTEVILGCTLMEDDGRWRYRFTEDGGQLSRHALGQLCARLMISGGGTLPAAYLARCPGSLAAVNVNYWLAHGRNAGRKVLVRAIQGDSLWYSGIRAVLSPRYAFVDHLPLLETLSDMVPGYNLSLQGWSFDDELLTLRLVLNEDHPASLADPLRIGLHITNSEIGLAKVSIAAYVTRLVCSNGMVVRCAELAGIHRRHVGRAGEDLYPVVYRGLTEVLREADEAAWRFDQLRSRDVPRPVEDFVRRTAREAELPDSYVRNVLAALEGETYYALINAFTRVAQELPVAERVRIETTMSQFLREARNGS